MSRNDWRPEERCREGLWCFRLAIYNGCRWRNAPVGACRCNLPERRRRFTILADLQSISSFRKAWKLRYGGRCPDVEQSGTLQEQLRAQAAMVAIVASSSSFYWRITSFCVYTATYIVAR